MGRETGRKQSSDAEIDVGAKSLRRSFKAHSKRAKKGYQTVSEQAMEAKKKAAASATQLREAVINIQSSSESKKMKEKLKRYIACSICLMACMALVLELFRDKLQRTHRGLIVFITLGIFLGALLVDSGRQWKEWQNSETLEGTRIKEVLLFSQLHFSKSESEESPLWKKFLRVLMNGNTVALVSTAVLWMNLTAIAFRPILPYGKSTESKPIDAFGQGLQVTLLDVDFLGNRSLSTIVFHASFWLCVPLIFFALVLAQRPLQARRDIVQVSAKRQELRNRHNRDCKVMEMLNHLKSEGFLHRGLTRKSSSKTFVSALSNSRGKSFRESSRWKRKSREKSSDRVHRFDGKEARVDNRNSRSSWLCCSRKSNRVEPVPDLADLDGFADERAREIETGNVDTPASPVDTLASQADPAHAAEGARAKEKEKEAEASALAEKFAAKVVDAPPVSPRSPGSSRPTVYSRSPGPSGSPTRKSGLRNSLKRHARAANDVVVAAERMEHHAHDVAQAIKQAVSAANVAAMAAQERVEAQSDRGFAEMAASNAARAAAEETRLRLGLIFMLIESRGNLAECNDELKSTEQKIEKLRDVAGSFTSMLCSMLFMIIIRTMLEALSCDFAGKFRSDYEVLLKDPNMRCFHGVHWIYVFTSVSALSIYYPVTVMCRPFFQLLELDLELLQQQEYVFVLVQLQTFISVIDVFFKHRPEVVLFSALLVHLIIATMVRRTQAYNVLEINDSVAPAFLFSASTACWSLVAYFTKDDVIATHGFYCSCGLFILLALTVYWKDSDRQELKYRQTIANLELQEQEEARQAHIDSKPYEKRSIWDLLQADQARMIAEAQSRTALRIANMWKTKAEDTKLSTEKEVYLEQLQPTELPTTGRLPVIPYFGDKTSFRDF